MLDIEALRLSDLNNNIIIIKCVTGDTFLKCLKTS